MQYMVTKGVFDSWQKMYYVRLTTVSIGKKAINVVLLLFMLSVIMVKQPLIEKKQIVKPLNGFNNVNCL